MKEMQGKIKTENFIDELFIAIKEHSLLKANICIRSAAYMNLRKQIFIGEKYGMKPISFAVKENSFKILRFLVNNGADVNAASSESLRVALHVAAEYGREDAGQLLLSRYAQINLQDIMGKVPLHLASFHCQVAMVELLIKHDANIYIRDAGGRIPLDVVGDDPKSICISNTRQKIIFILECADKEVNCQTLASRANPKVIEASNHSSYHNSTSVLSGTVKPSSFINNILSWVTTATLSSLFSSAPALPSAQQSVDHLDGSPIGSSQVDFNGTALLTDVMIRKFTGKKYSSLLEDSLLTIEEVRERKLNTIEKNFETALSKCEKLYQCPESSLSNFTISKGMHQKSL
ncbi:MULTISPECIES: ankyrin repeat domain-containing protein [Wolbachia]|uniref:ankyrin repeat domain-containing protein n=1 Tax=Wolbachia TaxID=953 RepID=UPI00201FDE77|nr:ankyrin repeat domain-containing protein [Wolbachia endosymbiont of Ostrinia scapulalis]URG40920.1 ankyrin repeat domain-containing protein [Wolbachia endosymbiont of Ostrinia scapulalis]